MTVYVDPLFQWPSDGYSDKQAHAVGARNKHTWCHMFTDGDHKELHAMAAKIGLRRSWFQRDHYDLTPGRRAAALLAGAKAVSRREAVAIWRESRKIKRQAKVTFVCLLCSTEQVVTVTEPDDPGISIVCRCAPDRKSAARRSVEFL